MNSPTRSSRRWPRRVAAFLVLMLVASACDYSRWEEGGEYRQYYCDPTDVAVNDGHGGGPSGGPHFPYTEEKGPLSGEDCFNLTFQIEVSAQYAALFPTKGIAEANGWHWLAPWIPGQGTHNTAPQGISTEFDPMTPTMLMFDGNGPDAPLTGMVWAVTSGEAPPEGFGGNNDHWHGHQLLCITPGPFVVGDSISDELCASRGGVNVDTSDTWLLHVWLPTYDGWEATDIFNKTHPNI